VIAAGVSPRAAPPILRAQAEASPSFGAFRAWSSRFFGDLWSVSNDLVVDLCVRSLPSRSEAWVQPKRYEPGRRIKLTDTEFLNLTRGLYVGRVTRPGLPPKNFDVDLVSESRVYVECALDALEEGVCDQQQRTAGFACRREGGR
jgi:hypothetical protein